MAFEQSPSLKEFEDGIPQKLSDSSAKRKKFRKTLITLLGLLILIVGFSFIQSNAAELLAGKGSISGYVRDDNGDPFQGYIFILGTELETQTDVEGNFLIEKVPAGSRILIVANEHAGYEFPVLVEAGQTIDIGELQFITTAIPDEG
jgi:hypothetical protein